LLSFLGIIVVSLVAGIFPLLLLIASRRKGDYVPRTVYRPLGHPVLLGGLYACGGGAAGDRARSRGSAGRTGGVIFAFHDRDERDGLWPRRALEAALCIAAGADLTRLTGWIAEGQRRAERVR
jgi:hypothetical protein